MRGLKANAASGPPGSACMPKKRTSVTRKRVGIDCPTLLAMNAVNSAHSTPAEPVSRVPARQVGAGRREVPEEGRVGEDVRADVELDVALVLLPLGLSLVVDLDPLVDVHRGLPL